MLIVNWYGQPQAEQPHRKPHWQGEKSLWRAECTRGCQCCYLHWYFLPTCGCSRMTEKVGMCLSNRLITSHTWCTWYQIIIAYPKWSWLHAPAKTPGTINGMCFHLVLSIFEVSASQPQRAASGGGQKVLLRTYQAPLPSSMSISCPLAQINAFDGCQCLCRDINHATYSSSFPNNMAVGLWGMPKLGSQKMSEGPLHMNTWMDEILGWYGELARKSSLLSVWRG